MTVCTSPGCAEPATVAGKFSPWCDSHAAILHHAAAECGERPKSNTIQPAATRAARAKLDQANAKRLAAAVHSGEPVDQIDGLRRGSEAWKSAVALATAEGWIKPEDGGFTPGDSPAEPARLTRRQKALKVARVARGRPLRRDDAAEIVGCAPATASRLLALAIEEGWLRRDGAGPAVRYIPTDAALPTD